VYRIATHRLYQLTPALAAAAAAAALYRWIADCLVVRPMRLPASLRNRNPSESIVQFSREYIGRCLCLCLVDATADSSSDDRQVSYCTDRLHYAEVFNIV